MNPVTLQKLDPSLKNSELIKKKIPLIKDNIDFNVKFIENAKNYIAQYFLTFSL